MVKHTDKQTRHNQYIISPVNLVKSVCAVQMGNPAHSVLLGQGQGFHNKTNKTKAQQTQ